MNFQEAQARFDQLLSEKKSGRISPQAFTEAVNNLRVADSQGSWWQPNPRGDGWLRWDGAAWQPAVPPLPSAPAAPHVSPPGASPAARPAPAGKGAKGAIAQKSQAWWDLLAIMGGATSAYLWLAYSSFRAFERSFAAKNWIVPVLMVILLLIMFGARRLILKALTPLWTKMQSMSTVAKIIIGFLAFIGVRHMFIPAFASRFGGGEGLDCTSAFLMFFIPLGLVWFRRETDYLLMPLQPVRRFIPRFILIGIGLVIPYFTAKYLYTAKGLTQYPLMHASVVWGTLLSYVVLRTPQGYKSGPVKTSPAASVLVFLFYLFLLSTGVSWADDFLRDPFNLNDGLRTPGWAPVLAGVSTTVVSILVNGVEVVKVILQGTQPVKEGEEPQHKQFIVIVNTVGKLGQPSTILDMKDNDTVFVYAHCEEAGKGPFPQGDPTIQFSLTNAGEWVNLEDRATQHGQRCASLSFKSTLPTGTPPAAASIHISAGVGTLISADVSISLVLGLALSAEVVNGERRLGTQAVYPVYCMRYEKDKNEWKPGEVVIYFHTPDSDTPVKPPFTPLWGTITASPDYLDFDTPLSDDGNLTWRVHPKIKSIDDIPDEWLMGDGSITVTFTCTEPPA